MRCISALRRVLSELQRSEPARVERSCGCQRQEHNETVTTCLQQGIPLQRAVASCHHQCSQQCAAAKGGEEPIASATRQGQVLGRREVYIRAGEEIEKYGMTAGCPGSDDSGEDKRSLTIPYVERE